MRCLARLPPPPGVLNAARKKEAEAKTDASIVEAALYYVSQHIKVDLKFNTAKVSMKRVIEAALKGNHGVIRVNLSGCNPFRWTRLRGTRTITCRVKKPKPGQEHVDFQWEHDFRSSG